MKYIMYSLEAKYQLIHVAIIIYSCS